MPSPTAHSDLQSSFFGTGQPTASGGLRRPLGRNWWVAPGVLVLGLFISLAAAYQQYRSNQSELHQATRDLAEQVADRSVAQLSRNALGLRGARGYAMGAGARNVTTEGFRAYFETRNLPQEFPGVLGVGLIFRVAPAAEAEYLELARRRGHPDFSLRQLQPHEGERQIIEFVEPVESNRAAIGLDIASEPSRRMAALQALSSDTPVLTGPIRLVQSKPGSSLGMLMLLRMAPSREPSLVGIAQGAPGFAYSPIQLDDVLASADLEPQLVRLTVTDITPGSPPVDYALPDPLSEVGVLPIEMTVDREVMGRTWRFTVHPREALAVSLHPTPPLHVFVFGVLSSMLLALMTHLWAEARRRRKATATERVTLGNLLDHATEAIVALDLQGRVELWNQAASQLFGYPSTLALGHDLESLIGSLETDQEHRQMLQRAARGEHCLPVETFRTHLDGGMVAVEVSASPIYGEHGDIVGVTNIFRPIGKRLETLRNLRDYGEQLEQTVSDRSLALRRVTNDLQQLLDVVPALIGAGDAQRHMRYANRALLDQLGLPFPLAPDQAWDGLPDWFGNQVRPGIDMALEGRAQPLNLVVPAGDDGAQRYLSGSIVPDRDDDGRVSGFFLLVSDVTEMKEVQLRLAASEERFRRLYRATPAMLHTVDPQGHLLEVSDQWCRTLAFTREEVVGRAVQDFLAPQSRVNSGQRLEQLFQSGSIGPLALQMIASDGRCIDISMRATVENKGHGDPLLALAVIEDVTLRLQAERALEAERLRLTNIIEGTGAGTWEWNVQTGEVRLSDRWADILGYALQELEPVSVETRVRLAHPQDQALAHEALRQHFRGEQAYYSCELRLRHKDGHWVWVQDHGRLRTRSSDGRPEWMIGTLVDISTRKQSELERHEQHEVMKSILVGAPVAVRVATLAESRVLMFNDQYLQVVQRTAEEATKLDVSSFYSNPEDHAFILNELSEGRSVSNRLIEFQRPHLPQAPHVWALCSYMRISYQGEPCSLAWIYDVTPLRDAQQAARHSQEVQAQALEATLAGLVIFDENDRLETANQRMFSLYPKAIEALQPGVSFEVFARTITEQYRGPNEVSTDDWVEERLANHRRGGTWVRRLADGRYIRVVERALSDGKFVSLRNDVTELVQAMEAAEAASRAKSDFLSSTSHEIRTPLNAILGLAYLLEREPLPSEARSHVRRISQAGRSLLSLVNDVLDLSKIEAGQVQLIEQVFNLRQLVSEVVSLLSTGLRNPHLQVRLELSPELPVAVSGDPGRLRQILQNLLGNGIKFTERGEVCLSVRPVEPAPSVLFEVRDTGIGIAPDVQARLFRPFEQADSSISRRYGGTGLGLSITSRLVALMSGSISVDSQPGAGATFRVLLPLPAVDAVPGRPFDSPTVQPQVFDLEASAEATPLLPLSDRGLPDAPPSGDAATTRSGEPGLSRARLLVVDDSVLNLEVARRVLELEGATVEVAESGEAALRRLAQGKPALDAVLLDVMMPGMDGLETVRRLRAMPGFQTLPVIALTAGVLDDQRRAAMEAGMTDFLSKPLEPERIVGCLRQHIRVWSPPPASAPAQPPAAQPPRLPIAQSDGVLDERLVPPALRQDRNLLISLVQRLTAEFADLHNEPEDQWPARLHKLKGSALTIGAPQVAHAAAQAEAALRQGESASSIRSRMSVLMQHIGALAQWGGQATEIHLEATSNGAGNALPNGLMLTDAELEMLRTHIDNQSTRAGTELERLHAAFEARFGAETLHSLRMALRMFDFESAAQLLAR